MKISRFFLGILLLGSPCLLHAQSSFSKPKKLQATYDPSQDRVVVQWKKVSGAEEYRLVVLDDDGKKILRKRMSKRKKKIKTGRFSAEASYTVKVKVVASGSKKASKFSTVPYVHLLTRAAGKGKLLSTNSAGRHGSYYLPPKFASAQSPVMVAFHGQDSKGSAMVNAFAALAKEFGFIIVAPSSRFSPDGIATWEIGTTPNSFTEDFIYTQTCMEEVFGFEGVSTDVEHFLTIGYSAGGSSAPYFATNNDEFTDFAVLHGGLAIGGLGEGVLPGWFSTGTSDTLRTPTELQGYVTALTAAGFPDVMFTPYETDHTLSSDELRDVVKWWLGK